MTSVQKNLPHFNRQLKSLIAQIGSKIKEKAGYNSTQYTT